MVNGKVIGLRLDQSYNFLGRYLSLMLEVTVFSFRMLISRIMPHFREVFRVWLVLKIGLTSEKRIIILDFSNLQLTTVLQLMFGECVEFSVFKADKLTVELTS